MLIASSYPLLEVFWTMLFFVAFVVWLWILFTVIGDIFRRRASGWVKVAWLIFVIVFPYFGVFVYLIAEHRGMTERTLERQSQAQEQMADYVRSVSHNATPAEEIANAKQLLDAGTISSSEFEQMKLKALTA